MIARIAAFVLSLHFLFATATAQTVRIPAFDGARSFRYLESICALGPRISGTKQMTKQQELIEQHFTKLGAQVNYQDFDAPHPITGEPVRMRNMVIVWRPEAKTRVLLCCHYDTRPQPDREPNPAHHKLPFIGANDGASGVAVMMELGNQFATLATKPAVDFVIFDGEELVYSQDDKYFYGSEHFSKAYRDNRAKLPTYTKGVLLDMVAGKDAQFFYEGNSVRYAPGVTREVWSVAQRLGVREFVAREKYEVLDDHIALNQIAGIPTTDVIDFDFPHWHMRNDIPAACSADTLFKVGRVISAWILMQK